MTLQEAIDALAFRAEEQVIERLREGDIKCEPRRPVT